MASNSSEINIVIFGISGSFWEVGAGLTVRRKKNNRNAPEDAAEWKLGATRFGSSDLVGLYGVAGPLHAPAFNLAPMRLWDFGDAGTAWGCSRNSQSAHWPK